MENVCRAGQAEVQHRKALLQGPVAGSIRKTTKGMFSVFSPLFLPRVWTRMLTHSRTHARIVVPFVGPAGTETTTVRISELQSNTTCRTDRRESPREEHGHIQIAWKRMESRPPRSAPTLHRHRSARTRGVSQEDHGMAEAATESKRDS